MIMMIITYSPNANCVVFSFKMKLLVLFLLSIKIIIYQPMQYECEYFFCRWEDYFQVWGKNKLTALSFLALLALR